MTDPDMPVLIYTTWPDAEMAARAGSDLVMDRLAACVNILGPAVAIYEWEGALNRDTEHPMLIKTTSRCVPDVARIITAIHPYEVPAFAVLEIGGGTPEFLNWIAAKVVTPNTAPRAIEQENEGGE